MRPDDVMRANRRANEAPKVLTFLSFTNAGPRDPQPQDEEGLHPRHPNELIRICDPQLPKSFKFPRWPMEFIDGFYPFGE
jgi:hypothetical protein